MYGLAAHGTAGDHADITRHAPTQRLCRQFAGQHGGRCAAVTAAVRCDNGKAKQARERVAVCEQISMGMAQTDQHQFTHRDQPSPKARER